MNATSTGSTTADIMGTQTPQTSSSKKKNKKDHWYMHSIKSAKDMLSEALKSETSWKEFIDTLSDNVLKSDKKLTKLIEKYQQSQKTTIEKAIALLKKKFIISGTEYKIEEKIETDDKGNCCASLRFIPKGKNKNHNFKDVKICFDESNRPSFFLSDEAKEFFTKHFNDDLATAIRGKLITIQDKDFAKLDKTARAFDDLNTYMDALQKRINDLLHDMPAMDITILKKILKNRYGKNQLGSEQG